MSLLKFSDGIQIDTSGELRELTLTDGLYVVGQGLLIPVSDKEEAQELINRLSKPEEEE